MGNLYSSKKVAVGGKIGEVTTLNNRALKYQFLSNQEEVSAGEVPCVDSRSGARPEEYQPSPSFLRLCNNDQRNISRVPLSSDCVTTTRGISAESLFPQTV
ncbi:hypothetical protein RRG08_063966 [Elysia crispata]|uniref:Uncharacterized protein n=1 Tax=Elysia crispata TaxID=231223 RepID=A0AAE0YFC8_9GAST|nr:hypothetical protein RRG08_063966 [Elysia crispata]